MVSLIFAGILYNAQHRIVWEGHICGGKLSMCWPVHIEQRSSIPASTLLACMECTLQVWHRPNKRLAACMPVCCRYVDFDLAQETATHIAGIRQWVTNEYMHSGIRDDGYRIFEHLLALARGSVPLQ